MAIKNKDGSVFKLRCPNPLMKDMADWDKTKLQLINMEWKSEVVIDERSPVKEAQENIIDIGEELNLESISISPQEFIEEIVVPTVKEPETPVITADSQTAKLLKERGVTYFCAPVIGFKVHTDDLYGESYQTPQYGEKFLFDAIVIEESDMQLQFWCVRSISKGTIIYRKTTKSMPDGRWWRIEKVESKSNGCLCIANISEINPDFS